jgi:hypothetical protein
MMARHLLGGVIAFALATLAAPAPSHGSADKPRLGPRGQAFYDPPRPLPAGRHGKLIWARPIPAPKRAKAWKVLYRSTLHDGRAVAVSGLVIAPAQRAPREGRPVVAWAHGTIGGARRCAPSMPANPARNLASYYTYSSPYFIDVGVPDPVPQSRVRSARTVEWPGPRRLPFHCCRSRC